MPVDHGMALAQPLSSFFHHNVLAHITFGMVIFLGIPLLCAWYIHRYVVSQHLSLSNLVPRY
jgi:hypothetical protein